MIRRIIQIDQEKCNGCGICADACHEGAIGMVDGKAALLREDYCDGLGDCLPACPMGAISFVERYDEAAVKAAQAAKQGGCPGSRAMALDRASIVAAPQPQESQLRNWPVQIKLAPINAPYFNGANLLIAADCTAYSYANFHQEFIRNKVTLIGCPKLDVVDYSQKLKAIIAGNDIKSLTILRMEVPCCGGLEYAAKKALQESGKFIPWQVVTISVDGKVLK